MNMTGLGVSFKHNYDAETLQSQGDPCTKICVRPLADTIILDHEIMSHMIGGMHETEMNKNEKC
jgi:hypothetical protein